VPEQHKPVRTLADVKYDGKPECFHCDIRLPKTAKADRQGSAIVVTCPKCGCMTPFPIAQN
jgi:transcription elongation factor Elf1